MDTVINGLNCPAAPRRRLVFPPDFGRAAAFAYRGELSGEVRVMPQQTPQVPEQSDRAQDAPWDLPGRLRQDILSSWKRSLLAGLAPERFKVPHVTDVDEDGPLAWTAAPVMARIAEDLEGTGIGILLADSRGHIISRTSGDRHVLRLLDQVELAPGSLYDEDHVGTNAIGTAVFKARPSVVAGPEHFADALGKMACAASPVTDADGRLIGVLDLTCAAQNFHPLMLPFVKHAAAEITAELAAGRLAVARGGLALRTAPEDAMLPVPGWADLTDTQRMVAELVMDGLTNRDAGARLFLSPHTIDFHLRQIYRRLGVRSRVELARLAGPPRARALPGPAALPTTAAQRDATLPGPGRAELLSLRNDQRLRKLASVT
jgi:sigma-54 dependent transcriptional regulator, acetoin dehydrogenase operon transcriptional activator AcoR